MGGGEVQRRRGRKEEEGEGRRARSFELLIDQSLGIYKLETRLDQSCYLSGTNPNAGDRASSSQRSSSVDLSFGSSFFARSEVDVLPSFPWFCFETSRTRRGTCLLLWLFVGSCEKVSCRSK